jgi:hypothetical protein
MTNVFSALKIPRPRPALEAPHQAQVYRQQYPSIREFVGAQKIKVNESYIIQRAVERYRNYIQYINFVHFFSAVLAIGYLTVHRIVRQSYLSNYSKIFWKTSNFNCA